jgi:hypothetical protein
MVASVATVITHLVTTGSSDQSVEEILYRRASVLREAMYLAARQGWPGAEGAVPTMLAAFHEWRRATAKRNASMHRDRVQALAVVFDPNVRAIVGFHLWNQMRALAIRGMWPAATRKRTPKTSKGGGVA